MPAFPAGLFQQAHFFNNDTFVDSLSHIVNSERRDSCRNHRFHLYPGLRAGARGGVDLQCAIFGPRDRNIYLSERQRVRKRDQVCGLLCGHDARELRGNKRVALWKHGLLQRALGFLAHTKPRSRAGGANRDGFF